MWAGQPKEKEKKENPCVLRWHVTQVDTPEGSPPPTLHAVCKGSQVVVKEPPEEKKRMLDLRLSGIPFKARAPIFWLPSCLLR